MLNLDPLRALAETWETESESFRRRGLEREATMCESFADDLRNRIREWATEPLTVAEAAAESGYSESRLRDLLSEDRVTNAGEDGAPRIRRQDLPSKPGGQSPSLELLEGGANQTIAEKALARRGA